MVLAALLVPLGTLVAGCAPAPLPLEGRAGSPTPVVRPTTPGTSTPRATTSPTSRRTPPVRVSTDLIAYPQQRKDEMAAYSLRHYGTSTWRLTPSMIVLHYTAGATWESARDTFAADAPNVGELPGTCSHYVIDRDGTIHALVPVTVRCRHTIGLNDRAIGIELVQPALGTPAETDRAILGRPAQVDAALALVRSLQATWHIPTSSVVGHATANDDPHFRDLQGWRNDHVDWQAADVAEFRRRL